MCTPDADWFTSGTVSFELIKGLPAALITLGLGWIAIQIQRNQVRVAKAKLNLDLFDRRLDIFEKTWGIVSTVSLESASTWHEHLLMEFSNLKPQAHFLFGQEIFNYMVEVHLKAIELRSIERQLGSAEPEKRKEIEKQYTQLSTWFIDEAKVGCRNRFLEYLDFSKWRG